MKSIIPSFFGFVLLGTFFTPFGSVFAQTPALVATVNIEGARIESQIGNEISLYFILTNREQAQSGLRYGAQLIQKTPKGQFVVHEHVFDEEISLSENTKIEKRVAFSAPAQLDGEYLLFVTVKNQSNFPFAVAFVDNVLFSPQQKGVSIDPGTCVIKTTGNTFTLSQIVSLTPKELFFVSCEATNYSGKAVEGTFYGDVAKGSRYTKVESTILEKSDTVIFQLGERKTITLSMQAPEKPFKYEYSVGFSAPGLEHGSVQFSSVVEGDRAIINNLSFDKEKYVKGDVAELLLLWEASFMDNSVKAKASPDVVLNLKVTNAFGVECASSVTQQLSRFRTVSRIPVPITRDCANPKAQLSLSDTKGNILDQKEFKIDTEKNSPVSKKTTVMIIVGVLVLLSVAIFQRLKKQNTTPSSSSGISTGTLLFVLVLGLGAFFPMSSVSADNYSYTTATGETITTTVNLDSSNYNPNVPILVTAYITNSGGNGNSFPVSLTANNNNGSSVTLIPTTTLGTGSTPMSVYTSFSTPPSAGAFAVNFTTSVEEPDTPSISLLSFSALQGWDCCLGVPVWEADVRLSEKFAGQTFEIRFDGYQNGYYMGQYTLSVTSGSCVFGTCSDDYGFSQSTELQSYQTYAVNNACILSAPPTVYVDPSYLCN